MGGPPAGPRILRARPDPEIESHCFPDEFLQRGVVDLVLFPDVDGAPDLPLEAGVEQARRIPQRSALEERQLDDGLVGLAGADAPVAGPDRRSGTRGFRPLPLLDDLGIGLPDDPADVAERLAAPVAELRILSSIRSEAFAWSAAIRWRMLPPPFQLEVVAYPEPRGERVRENDAAQVAEQGDHRAELTRGADRRRQSRWHLVWGDICSRLTT